MPSSVQIVPKHTFPHEETYINDNTSGAFDDPVESVVRYPYLSVFTSSRGLDGQLVKISSNSEYYRVFGKTNFKKYGQPHLMPEAILNQQDTEVWCMRVMPEDSLYANSVLSAWYKKDVDNKAFRLKFTTKTITTDNIVKGDYNSMTEILHSRPAIEEYGNLLDGTPVDGVYTDDEGYTQVPIAVFTAPGRGVYGRNLRWRIVPNEDYENEYKIKVYTFQVLDTESSSTLAASHVGTIVSTTALDTTIFINDIIEDINVTSLGAYIKVNEENVEELYNTYVDFCKEVVEANPSEVINIPNLDEFDLFFGKAVKNQKVRVTPSQPYLTYVEELTDDVNQDDPRFNPDNYTLTPIAYVDNVAGNILEGGSDGAFAETDAAKRQKSINECYKKAFNGEYDKLILAPRRIKSLALFDAAYDMDVKIELARLGMYRSDCPVYLDTQYIETLGNVDIKTLEADFEALDNLVENFDNFDEAWCVSVNTHWYYIKEPSTGKRVPVTMTYFLAATDAEHRQANGSVYPRVGVTTTLTGHIKNSVQPCIAENEKDLKQALYDARINYFEDDGDNVFTRGSQSMYVSSNSDLIEESNVIALFEFKRALEDECRKNRYMITTPARRAEFRTFLLEKYSYMIGDYFNTMDIRYKSNEYESQRNIVHVYAAVSFPKRSKITLIEIDVNRAEYQPDVEEE